MFYKNWTDIQVSFRNLGVVPADFKEAAYLRII